MVENLLEQLNDRLRASRPDMQVQQVPTASIDVQCQFHEGPKNGETVTITVPADRGYPQRIFIVSIDPDTHETRKGVYGQSALAESLYVWIGWEGPPEPILTKD